MTAINDSCADCDRPANAAAHVCNAACAVLLVHALLHAASDVCMHHNAVLCTYMVLSTLPFMQALSAWPKPAPGSLYALAARLQPEGLPLCCKAVHMDPWQASHRELLGILAA